MKYKTILCNRKNYGIKRSHNSVFFVVIHYTAVDGDTAKNEGIAFKTHITKTSAHFFIDQTGAIVKSVPLDYVAWSVGGARYSNYKETGGAKYYKRCTNSNSVSIELCDNLKKDPSKTQIKSVIECIKYIKKYCPNAKTIIRHFDVNGKCCPARMISETKWKTFKKQIGE